MSEKPARLTPHEIRVIQLLADGHSLSVVADMLGVSINTVAFYLRGIYAKLGARSKIEAVVYALRHGLIE